MRKLFSDKKDLFSIAFPPIVDQNPTCSCHHLFQYSYVLCINMSCYSFNIIYIVCFYISLDVKTLSVGKNYLIILIVAVQDNTVYGNLKKKLRKIIEIWFECMDGIPNNFLNGI